MMVPDGASWGLERRPGILDIERLGGEEGGRGGEGGGDNDATTPASTQTPSTTRKENDSVRLARGKDEGLNGVRKWRALDAMSVMAMSSMGCTGGRFNFLDPAAPPQRRGRARTPSCVSKPCLWRSD